MSRLPRRIISNQVYHICMRTRRGLPFRCLATIALILWGIMARVQRDNKVKLCHFVWMANHAHMIVVAQDSDACKDFYGQIQKQITDAFKKLLGLKQLSLWKDNATRVIHLKDLASVKGQIAYLYANPSRAGLVDKIEQYPGISSWEMFRGCINELSCKVSRVCPWIRWPQIRSMSSGMVDRITDERMAGDLSRQANISHDLVLQPNAWMKVFRIEDSKVERVNKVIIKLLKKLERKHLRARADKGREAIGANRLIKESLNMNYESENNSRNIAVYAHCPKLRVKAIAEYQAFRRQCRECYARLKLGHRDVDWPPGAFPAAAPPRANYF